MNIPRLTKLNIVDEAVANSRCGSITITLKTIARISTRAQRAHNMLDGLRPGDCRHIASRGELSLHDVAESIATLYGPFACLTLSTWAASEDSIKKIIALRTAGHVARLEAFVDSRMPTDCPDAHALMALSFDAYRAGSNHSKLMAFTGAQNQDMPSLIQGARSGIAVVSTANLTHNPRCEVLVVALDSALAEFHRDWIREEISRAE